MRELTKFYDKDQKVWEIKKEKGTIVLAKEGVDLVYFIDDSNGTRMMKRKIKKLKGE